MIGKFLVQQIPEYSIFRHAAGLGLDKVTFTPGLNVVVGPNASGKSTLLRMLAAGCYAHSAGYPLLSVDALQNDFDFEGRDLLAGFHVEHDGQVAYFSSREFESETHVAAGYKDSMGDLMASRWRNIIRRRSAGEAVLAQFDAAYHLMRQEIEPERYMDYYAMVDKRLRRFKHAPNPGRVREIHDEVMNAITQAGKYPREQFPVVKNAVEERKGKINDVYLKRYQIALKRFTPSLSASKPTLLLDEPDAHLGLLLQARVWRMLTHTKVLDRYQIIVATHSLCAWQALAGRADANIIEMQPGYFKEVADELSALGQAKHLV